MLKAYFQNVIRVTDVDPKTGAQTTKAKFVYLLAGDAADMASYKKFKGEHFSMTESGHAKWFANEFVGSVAEMQCKVDATGKTYWFANNEHKRGLEALLSSMDESNPVRADILAEYKQQYCTFTPATPPELADAPVAKPAKPAKPAALDSKLPF